MADIDAIAWRSARLSGRAVLLVPTGWCVPHADATFVEGSIIWHRGHETVVIPDPWLEGPDAFWLAPMPDMFSTLPPIGKWTW